jgi:hypothetical protein
VLDGDSFPGYLRKKVLIIRSLKQEEL